MRFRPCIDIHNGKVKQIVGSSLQDAGDSAMENFVASKDAVFYARIYKELGLSGGHIILLNPVDSPYYESTKRQALEALSACPGLMQIGGGITADNAKEFLDAGACHVIVTSYVFKNGRINYTNLKKLVKAVGKERIVLDLSCKLSLEEVDRHIVSDTEKSKKKSNREELSNSEERNYYIVTDRWQKMTKVLLDAETLGELSEYCDEFLIHAADVEGKQKGIEENVAKVLGDWGKKPITYAGGVHSLEDISLLKEIGNGKLDVTIGSALDIFGGSLKLADAIKACK